MTPLLGAAPRAPRVAGPELPFGTLSSSRRGGDVSFHAGPYSWRRRHSSALVELCSGSSYASIAGMNLVRITAGACLLTLAVALQACSSSDSGSSAPDGGGAAGEDGGSAGDAGPNAP